MHVLIPYALSEDASMRDALRGVALPALQALVRDLQRDTVLEWPPLHPVAPHEHWLAQVQGLDPAAPPWAALRARALGAAHDSADCWAFLSPSHWELGQTRVSLRDPAELALSAEEAQALQVAMAPYFAEDGLVLQPDLPGRWLVRGEPLRGLVAAEPDRVLGRDVAPWMPASALLQRLQSEMQMLLYGHTVNDARSARGAWTVNGFWLHGIGSLPDPLPAPHGHQPEVWDTLREAALRLDTGAWLRGWQTLDARLGTLREALRAGEEVSLTLAGEHVLHHYAPGHAGWWARLRRRYAAPSLSEILVTA